MGMEVQPVQRSVLFLYGSETGNAEGICHELRSEATREGYTGTISTLNQHEASGFVTAPVVVIVCSTTGDAEFPENARKFAKWLKKKAHPRDLLQGIQYAVLALGDTNYAQFCKAGRAIDLRMRELGASPFLERGDADEAVGLEAVVEPWKAKLWAVLPSAFGAKSALPSLKGPAVSHGKPLVVDAVLPQICADAAQPDVVMGLRPAAPQPPPAADTDAADAAAPPAADAAAEPRTPTKPVLFLFGSETGNAEGICHELCTQAQGEGYTGTISTLNQHEASGFVTAPVVVIVCSTTGDAEFPENARKFAKWLKKKAHPRDLLQGIQYAVLALGDTNYAQFCKAGRAIDLRMRELGASPFLERGDADEAVGLEAVVEPWKAKLWAALPSVTGACEGAAPQDAAPGAVDRKASVLQDCSRQLFPESPSRATGAAAPEPVSIAVEAPQDVASPAVATPEAPSKAASPSATPPAVPPQPAATAPRPPAGAASPTAAAPEAPSKAASPGATPPAAPAQPAATAPRAPAGAASPGAPAKGTPQEGVKVGAATTRVPPAGSNRKPLLFLYGSETGNAEGICHELHTRACREGYTAQIAALNQHESVGFAMAPLLVIVCSTTGDAEAPENARKFVKWLKKKAHPRDLLQGMQYSVLALGDTNYAQFCRAGRVIDLRMRELGASPFLDRGDADEAVGLEVVVEPWKAKLWSMLPSLAALEPAPAKTQSTNVGTPSAPSAPAPAPFKEVSMSSTGASPSMDLKRPQPQRISLPYPLSTASSEASPRRSGSSSPGLSESNLSQPSSRSPCMSSKHFRAQARAMREATANAWSKDKPFTARVIGWRRMTAEDAPRQTDCRPLDQVIKMTLSVPGWQWLPGDSIGVVPENNRETVRALLQRLRIDPAEPFPKPADDEWHYVYKRIPWPAPPQHLTVEEVLLKYIDLYPKDTKVLQVLAQALPKGREAEEERLKLKEYLLASNAFRTQVIQTRASILDILNETVPNSCPNIRQLVQCLKILQPRYYSIASSPLMDADRLDIAFTVVNYVPPKRTTRVHGVCTSWLEGLCQEFDRQRQQGIREPDVSIPIFLKPTHSFLLPSNLRAPLIMIGPGTGVAPFVAMMQHRRKLLGESQPATPASPTESSWNSHGMAPPNPTASSPLTSVCSKDDMSVVSTESSERSAIGESHLFFGCRHKNSDFLFCDEIEQFVEDGTLTSLHLALSQEGEEGRWYGGCYVQDKMMESSIRIAHLLLSCKAHIYVCGDAQSMARDVRRILYDILEEVEGLNADEAYTVLEHISSVGRYHEDIY